MFEQIASLLTETAHKAVSNNPEIPQEQKAEVADETVKSITGSLQNAFSGGNMQDIAGMFSGSGSGGGALAQGISGDLISNLTQKLGIGSGAAQSLGASIIPMLLEKVQSMFGGGGAAGGGFDISSMLSSLTSGGGLDQNKDGKVDLNDAIDFLKGGSKDGSDGKEGGEGIGGMLKGLFGK